MLLVYVNYTLHLNLLAISVRVPSHGEVNQAWTAELFDQILTVELRRFTFAFHIAGGIELTRFVHAHHTAASGWAYRCRAQKTLCDSQFYPPFVLLPQAMHTDLLSLNLPVLVAVSSHERAFASREFPLSVACDW
jgi:hypothetical protein